MDDIDCHIGKRSCAGMGKTRFTITDSDHLITLINLYVDGYTFKVCKDEYGQEFTAVGMFYEIHECNFIKESKCKFC